MVFFAVAEDDPIAVFEWNSAKVQNALGEMRAALARAPPGRPARPAWCTNAVLLNADDFELELVREMNRLARGGTAAKALTKNVLYPNSLAQFTHIVGHLGNLGNLPLFREIGDGNLPFGKIYGFSSETKGWANPVPVFGKRIFE